MTRSMHTDPMDIRAARRLGDPYAARGLGDSRLVYRLARSARLRGGAVPANPHSHPQQMAARIRIIYVAPGAGAIHPATPSEVRKFVDRLPPRYRYTLRSIELRPAPMRRPGGAVPLGRLFVPGRVILYAQPRPPWLLGGILTEPEQQRLRAAGAQVSVDYRSCLTVVNWTAPCLRDFMLRDVLLHELTHHLLQVRHGRSRTAAARTADHEAAASVHRPRFSWGTGSALLEYA